MQKEKILLDRITIEPETPATSCVIWLHGLGDSGAGFAPVVPHYLMIIQYVLFSLMQWIKRLQLIMVL